MVFTGRPGAAAVAASRRPRKGPPASGPRRPRRRPRPQAGPPSV